MPIRAELTGHVSDIRERNTAPKQEPKAPKKAPFEIRDSVESNRTSAQALTTVPRPKEAQAPISEHAKAAMDAKEALAQEDKHWQTYGYSRIPWLAKLLDRITGRYQAKLDAYNTKRSELQSKAEEAMKAMTGAKLKQADDEFWNTPAGRLQARLNRERLNN